MSPTEVMLAKLSQQQAETSQIESAGFDCGNGVTKLALSGSEVRVPSYVLPLQPEKLYDAPAAISGGLVAYEAGDRTDLIGSQWLAGAPAYQRDPVAAFRVVDDPEGKIRYALQLFLAGVATLPYLPNRMFNVVASVHHQKALGEALTEALGGIHTVQFGSSNKHCTVMIRVLRTLEEGAGVIVSAGFSPDSQALVYDFGSGTTIVTAFGARGKMLDRTVISGGVEDLIDAIARNLDTVKRLYREGDRQIIRAGIEAGDFQYGTTAWNFTEIYLTELRQWIVVKLKPALKSGSKHSPTSDRIIACGGGSQLPMVSELLQQHGITPLPDGALANAKGLHRLALLLGRGGVMARLSIDDDSLTKLKGYALQFGTDDPSKLILMLAVERDALVRCMEVAHSKSPYLHLPQTHP